MEKNSSWEYDAPQYFDFASPAVGDDNAEQYFNTDHENIFPKTSSYSFSTEVVSSQEVRVSIESTPESFYTPNDKKKSANINTIVQVTVPITPNVLKRIPRERKRNENVKNLKHNYANKRVKVAVNRVVNPQSAKKKFSKILRRTDNNLSKYHPCRTIPQPFLFHGKQKEAKIKQNVVTLAEACHKFTSGADLRSNKCSKGTLSMTRPISPKLTKPRRGIFSGFLSHLKKKELELEKECKNQFKATEVNKKILEHPSCPAKLPPKPATVVKEFDLTKPANKTNKSFLEPHPLQFTANPVPARILKKIVGVGVKKELPITVPMSPAFSKLHATKKKIALDETMSSNESRMVHERDSPLKLTKPVPFSFEGKEQEAREKKARMIEEEEKRAKEARKFVANPLPLLTASPTLPCKKSRPTTTVEPFDFPGGKKSKESHQKWKERLELVEKQEKEMKEFKARPATVLSKQVWVPEKSDNHSLLSVLTDTRNVPSNTEKRAEERKEWQAWIEIKEREKEEEKRKRQEEEKVEEERDICSRREQTVHHAQPVHHYNPIIVKPSNRPITLPESPHFSQRISSKYIDKVHNQEQ